MLKATEIHLHDRQLYIMDEILSLFGKDIENNIVVAFNLIKTSKIACAK